MNVKQLVQNAVKMSPLKITCNLKYNGAATCFKVPAQGGNWPNVPTKWEDCLLTEVTDLRRK